MSAPQPRLQAVSPTSAAGERLLRAYMEDVVSRYWGRPATAVEVDRALRDDPSDDLQPPTGLLMLADVGGTAIGCGGVRISTEGIAELTRMWVNSTFRRRGIGEQLVDQLERYARTQGCKTMRLDTRSDLTEARALYASLGYREVEPFSDATHADHWFEKTLEPSEASARR